MILKREERRGQRVTRDKRRCRVGDDKLGGRHSNDGLVDGAEGGHPNLGCHVFPPGHKSIFNPIVPFSPMGAYEVKLAYFGCHFGCHFLRLVLKLFLNLWGYGLV